MQKYAFFLNFYQVFAKVFFGLPARYGLDSPIKKRFTSLKDKPFFIGRSDGRTEVLKTLQKATLQKVKIQLSIN